ncbi:MAG: amidohydrolase [Pseudomonadota bacterium]
MVWALRSVWIVSTGLLVACTAPEPATNAGAQSASQNEPLTAFVNGTVHTGTLEAPMAAAVLVNEAGIITAVLQDGDDAETAATTVVDLGGAHLYPGFTDAHVHLRGIGQRELTLNLADVASIADLVARIEAEVSGLPAGAVVFGRGWIETGWPEGRMPSAADLDTVAPDNPVILIRADGHALVANTAAMDAGEITTETPDPDGGAIERGPGGAATGILIDNAMPIVTGQVARADESDVIQALAVGAEVYVQRGWTGVHNMSVAALDARLIERLDLEGRMPLRVYNALEADAFDIAANRAHETDTVTNRAVKLYMDGALGSRGALLSEPYADRPDTVGLSLMNPEALDQMFDRASASEVQLAIHAIGDLANARVIDAAETSGDPDARHRIEHTQILRTADIARMAPVGLIASMQPSHAIGDLKFAPDRLGMERLRGAYAWQSLIDAGTIVAGGSDAPVEVGSPLIEFYGAAVRKDLEGRSGEGWHPEEAVSRETALKMLTYWPAYAAFQEDVLGTVEVGKIADFTVFDRDLLTIPDAEILEAKAVMTVVDGDVVWSAE